MKDRVYLPSVRRFCGRVRRGGSTEGVVRKKLMKVESDDQQRKGEWSRDEGVGVGG